MKIGILYNGTAGKDESRQLAEELAQKFVGEEVNLHDVLQKNWVASLGPVERVIIIGGDGTINHCVDALKDRLDQLTIGIIPGGTVNNLARALELPLDSKKAMEVVTGDRTKGVDYGVVNGQVMVSSMTIGILADTAARISQRDKQKYGKSIFVRRFIELLARKRKYHLKLKMDEQVWEGTTQLVSVTMTNSVGGFTNFDLEATIDDGLFHVIVLPKLQFFRLMRFLPLIIAGRIAEIPEIEYCTCQHLTVTGPKGVSRIDGDPGPKLPLEMKVIKKGMTILVPK